MKKYISIIAIIIFIAIVSGFFMLQQANKNSKYITLIVDYNNSKKQEFRTPSSEEKSAWSLLQQASVVSGVTLEPTDDFKPQRIGDFKNGFENKQWNFYVNNNKQDKSPYDVKVKAPDKVVFRFE